MNTAHPTGRRPHDRVAAIAVAATLVPSLLSVAAADPPPASGGSALASVAGPARSAATGRLVSSSFLGGQEWDEATDVAVDRRGNTYLTGFTLSDDFPVAGPRGRGHAGIVDAFVTKVAAGGGRIAWSTHLGGIDHDAANAITVDRSGHVYVVGRTGSPDFPTKGGLQDGLRGRGCNGEPCHDAFVVKLSRTGRVQWSTLLGGTRNEEAMSVAVDDDSAVYVAGLTDSANLPVRSPLQGSFQSLPCEGDAPCPYDAFVAKLAPTGDRLVYSTYLGGHGGDVARGIDVDADHNAYVTGSTSSSDFPKVRAFQNGLRGRHCGPPPGEPCRQAFLTKLAPDGSSAAYSTLLGGQDDDDGYAVAVDRRDRAHVTGSTKSADFPTRRAIQATLNDRACTSPQPLEACDDAFVTTFAASGRRLRASTYLGGRAEDQGLSIDVTPGGQALVGGRTDSTDFVTTADASQRTLGGYIDGFAIKLRRSGSRAWSTFVGGSDADRVTGIAVDRTGAAHVVGRTLSPDFPTVQPFQPALEDEDYDASVGIIR